MVSKKLSRFIWKYRIFLKLLKKRCANTFWSHDTYFRPNTTNTTKKASKILPLEAMRTIFEIFCFFRENPQKFLGSQNKHNRLDWNWNRWCDLADTKTKIWQVNRHVTEFFQLYQKLQFYRNRAVHSFSVTQYTRDYDNLRYCFLCLTGGSCIV